MSPKNNVAFSVLLVRHAPVQGKAGVCYGRQEVELCSGWEALVENLFVFVKKLSCTNIYTSPSKRCYEMADRLAKKAHITLIVDHRLLELNFGLWEGQRWETIDRSQLDLWAMCPETFAPPKGESGLSLCQRVKSFWQEIVQKKQSVCVISHGGPLRVLKSLAIGEQPYLLAPSMPQGSFCLLPIYGDNPFLSRAGK